MADLRVKINGRELTARPGETLLDCALRHDINIPHLCSHPALEPFGACRMCLVEVDGIRGFPASCTTAVVDNMVVRTNTQELEELRRGVLELILLEHPAACLLCARAERCDEFRPEASKAGRTTGCHTCNAKEACDVRVLSDDLGVQRLPVPPTYRNFPLDRSDPFIDRDMNLCILCGRCVRICKAHQGRGVIDFIGRGSDTRIGSAFNRTLTETACTFCGSCVDVCPTGSLADRYAKWFGKVDTSVETTCMLCDAACAIQVGADRRGRLVSARAINPAVPLCVLGRFGLPELLASSGRHTVPKLRIDDVLREVTWEQALAETAKRLLPFAGDRFALVCDTTSTLEDRRVLARLTREVMGSAHYIELEPDAHGVSRTTLPDGVVAALLTGDFVASEELDALELLVVQDIYASSASARAHVLLPVAIFAEVDGSWLDASGTRRPLRRACKPPGQARPEWQVAVQLAQAMGASDFGYATVESIADQIDIATASVRVERDAPPAAAVRLDRRQTHFRGHRLADKIRGLQDLSDV